MEERALPGMGCNRIVHHRPHLPRTVGKEGRLHCNGDRKIRKYSGLQDAYLFQPVAFETLGVVGDRTDDFLRDLGKRVSNETSQPRAGEYLLQRLSIDVQRGNAVAVTATLPHGRGLPEFR